ncbi:MAG: T9SS type A sorting domain-containing protein [Flavobacteriales bacterium]|nr:T9SS type A sorting domain-containing protein [Flavobacteriales bacterium]
MYFKKVLLYLIFTVTAFLLNTHSSFAGTPSGGEITYKYLGNKQYEISVKFYRDCRGIPTNNTTYTIRCGTSATKNLTLTRVSIKDITPTCASVGVKCSPSNTTISSSSPAFEEHYLRDTLELGGADSAFNNCTSIGIGFGFCCRNGAITTGASGNNFWVSSTIYRSNTETNSSPVFRYPARLQAQSDQAAKFRFEALDSIDHDSLSYSFTDPMQSWTQKTNWGGTLSSTLPMTPYYPTGYNKAKGPVPDNNPPIGVSLDSTTGLLSFTPTDPNQTTILAVKVTEWRKDTAGKYYKIGEIIRDVQLIISVGANNIPFINAKSTYDLCEGETFNLNISATDKPYGSLNNDTMKFNYESNIPSSFFAINTSNPKSEALDFQWLTPKGAARSKPYIISVSAYDNACPLIGTYNKYIKLYVYPKVQTNSKVSKIKGGEYLVALDVKDNASPYLKFNNVTSSFPYDTRSFYFKSSNGINSTEENDTVVFRKNGTFYINQTFLSTVSCNQRYITDTIVVSGILEADLTANLDTILCKNTLTRLQTKIKNGKKPITYEWVSKTNSKTDTLGYWDYLPAGIDTIVLNVKDANGNTTSTTVNINVSDLPDITAGPDVKSCEGTTTIVVAKNLKSDTLVWYWTRNGILSSTKDTVELKQDGNYVLIGTNSKGCVKRDTLNFSFHKTREVSLRSGEFCQGKEHLVQSEIFGNGVDPNDFSNLSWILQKSLRKPDGTGNQLFDLLKDLDPSLKLNYELKFGTGEIKIPDNQTKDSLILRLRAWDENGCLSQDTMTVVITRHPNIVLGFKSFSICANDSIDLNTKVLTEGNSIWEAIQPAGYQPWPANTNISSGKIGNSVIPAVGGKYKVRLTSSFGACSSKDSVDIDAQPLGIPNVYIERYYDSIRFVDNSLNISERKWYIDNTYIHSLQELRVLQSEVDLKPVKLELRINDCYSDTTFILNTTGVSDLKSSRLSVYPNPAANVLNLRMLNAGNRAEYFIYGPEGKILLNGELNAADSEVNIESIENGVYFVLVKDGNKRVFKRFLKNSEN